MDLGPLLSHLQGAKDPNLLVGFDTADDAGVYRLADDLALVQTVDLITPVCDDPYLFGQVAAANALSDVYAMGGRPLTALNICCFPGTGVPDGVLARILAGGHDKMREAGATLVGGHTVRDSELKYGLAVTGTVHPDHVLRNASARPSDALVLTKPIGTGALINGYRKGLVAPDQLDAALSLMARLNDQAATLAVQAGARCATDVTGFGLAGHMLEIARASGVGLRIRFRAVPRYDQSLLLIEQGVGTAMTPSNRQMLGEAIRFDPGLTQAEQTLLFDPQTSGGLLIALPQAAAAGLLERLRERGVAQAALIGEAFASTEPRIEVLAA